MLIYRQWKKRILTQSLFPVSGLLKKFKKWLLLRLLEDYADRAAVLSIRSSTEGCSVTYRKSLQSSWRLVQLPAHWFPAGYENPYVWPDRWCLLP